MSDPGQGRPPASGDHPAAWWCRCCGLAVDGEPRVGTAVHAGSGRVEGDDGHRADPLDHVPPMWAAVWEIELAYKGAFDVSARLGFLCAYWSEKAVPATRVVSHYEAPGTDAGVREMYVMLDAATAGTRWARELEGSAP